MDPPSHPRPRPPNQRVASSRLTALPTPLSPRRQRPSRVTPSTSSFDPSSASTLRHPAWTSSIPPDAPPLGMDEVELGAKGERIGESRAAVEKEVERTLSDSTSSIPFPSTLEGPHYSIAATEMRHTQRDGRETPKSGPVGTSSDGGGSPNIVVDSVETEVAGTGGFDSAMLGQLSREELEKMLREADRIIRDKEQELSVFTAAGEGLLQEYHSLRNRHDSLVSRQRSTSGTHTSPLRPSRLSSVSLSPSHARVPSDPATRSRTWRNSLGLPSSELSQGQHRRVSSGRGGIVASSSYIFATSSSSQSLASTASHATTAPYHNGVTGTASPNTSPTAVRTHRLTSSSSVSSLFAPARRTVLSPKSSSNGVIDPREVEHLSHVNYSLSLRVDELEAESEFAEKEGRKKLRKLEKELAALREDLERSEGVNASLQIQMEREAEKKNSRGDKGKSQERDDFEEEQRQRTSTSTDASSISSDEAIGDKTISEAVVPVDGPRRDSLEFSPTRFLAPNAHSSLRSPGNGFARLRAVSSTSSLAPLPRIPSFDPSLLDAQQDELLNQLIAKIDELQEVNEAILEEREEMEERLEIAREEVREWMGKCEDLEGQQRIEWDGGNRQQIGWLDDESASPPDARRSRFLGGAYPVSRDGSPTPPSTALPDLGRSLRNELSGLWSQDSSTTPLDQDSDCDSDRDEGEEDEEGDDEDDEGTEQGGDSIIVHGTTDSNASTPVHERTRRRIRNRGRRTITPISFSARCRAATTTAHDLAPTGGLAISGLSDSKTYEELSTLADNLEPVWADEGPTPLPKQRLQGRGGPPLKLLEAPHVRQGSIEDEQSDRKDGKAGNKKGKKSNRSLVLSSIRFGSDEEDFDEQEEMSTPRTRRTSALRRLGLEASSRHTSRIFTQPSRMKIASEAVDEVERDDDNDDTVSIVSSDYDLLESRSLRRSNDYYPLTLRARYRPTMLAHMMTDSAIRHVVTFVTWVRFFVVLTMALTFAVWQGPRKTLGLVDGRRRLR